MKSLKTGLSSDTGDGALSTIEGPEVALYAEILSQSSLCFTGVSLGPRCRSCSGLDALGLPVRVTRVMSYGKIIAFTVGDDAILVSHNASTVIASDCEPNAAALIMSHANGEHVVIADRLKFVWARIAPSDKITDLCKWPSVIDAPSAADVAAAGKTLFTQTVCEALRAQRPLSGFGARLASEALYFAGVSPWRLVGGVTLAEWQKIIVAAHKTWHLSQTQMIAAPRSAAGLPSWPWRAPSCSVWARDVTDSGNPVIRERVAAGWDVCWDPSVQR